MGERGVSSILVIAIVIVIATWGVACSSSDNSSKTYLVLTTDRKVYSPGDEIKITLHNLSDENIWFTNTSFGLEFERWDGIAWVFYEGPGGGQIITSINPHGEVVVVQRLTVNLEGFHPGKYRVSTRSGYLDEVGGEYVQAYEEFSVAEASRWPLIAGIVGAIVLISIIATVYMRRR